MNKTHLGQKGRRLAMAFAVAASSLVSVAVASSSSSVSAIGPIQVIAPTMKKEYSTNRNEWVPAFSVKNSTNYKLVVSISFAEAPAGTTFSVSKHEGLLLGYGYPDWQYRTSISFTGSTDYVNNALASLKVHTTTKGKVTFKVTATGDDTTLVYEPVNSHYYGFVAAKNIKWSDALTAASALSFRGTSAYLASINSYVENDFVSYNIENASNVWIAATDKDAEGDFKWVTGEDAGKTFWKARCAAATGADSCTGANSVDAQGTYKTTNIDNPLVNTYSSWDRSIGRWGKNYEPNNWSGDEDYVVTNWQGSVGLWNDLKDTDTSAIAGYVVEYAPEPGKLFPGVVEARASYNVLQEPSPYIPRGLELVKKSDRISVDINGTLTVTWDRPSYSGPTGKSTLFGPAKLKGYYVTASTRGSQKLCTVAPSAARTCEISGFFPGEEVSIKVNAEYTKPPKADRLGRGQKVFANSKSIEPFEYTMVARLDAVRNRPVRAGTKVFIGASGLKPGSVYSVKADGVLVANGLVAADGTLGTGKYFLFPASALVSDRNVRQKVLYVLSAVNADGSVLTRSAMYQFKGNYYSWGRTYSDDGQRDYGMYGSLAVVPHTAIAS